MTACLVAIEEMLPQGRVTVALVRIGIGGLATTGIAMPSSIASIEGHLLLGGAVRFAVVPILLPLFPALVNVRAHRLTRRRQTRGTVREQQSKDHQGGKEFHDANKVERATSAWRAELIHSALSREHMSLTPQRPTPA